MFIKSLLSPLLSAKELKNILSVGSKFSDSFRLLEANVGGNAKQIYDL